MGELAGEMVSQHGSTSLVARITQALGQVRTRLHQPTIKSRAKPPSDANSQGAARALARASGLTLHHPFSSALRISGIALAILLAGSAFLAFRDQNRSTLHADRSGLNLTAPDDKSRQYVLLGRQDHDQGHYDAAIDDFKQAILLLPNNTEAHFLLAKSYKAAGRIEEALQSYIQVIKIDEKNLEARYQIAEIYRERGDWRAALPEYQRIIALDQSSEQALAAAGKIEVYSAQHAANYAPLRTARQLDTQPQPALRWLPSSDNGSHLHPLLPDLTLSALSRQPLPGTNNNTDDLVSARAIADDHIKNAERFSKNSQYLAAINEYQAALNLTPENRNLYYFIATAYNLNKQPVIAHEYYKKCLTGSLYDSICKDNANRTEKAVREAAKKEEAAKKKRSQGGFGKPFKSLINSFK